jgi:hypothetical protein
MAMWAIFAAPLLMSVDLRTLKSEYKAGQPSQLTISLTQRRPLFSTKPKNLANCTAQLLPLENWLYSQMHSPLLGDKVEYGIGCRTGPPAYVA